MKKLRTCDCVRPIADSVFGACYSPKTVINVFAELTLKSFRVGDPDKGIGFAMDKEHGTREFRHLGVVVIAAGGEKADGESGACGVLGKRRRPGNED